MKINRLHAIIGLLLVIIPFTGFTRGFKYGFSVVGGGVILFFAMRSIHAEIMKKQHRYKRHDSFVETKPKDFTHSKIKEEVKIESPKETFEESINTKDFGHIADNKEEN